MSGTLKEACGNYYPQLRMLEIRINIIKGGFLSCLPTLAFFWFNLLDKGNWYLTIISLCFFREFDVNSTS